MPTCKYEFNYNGQKLSFHSEGELIRFLKNNQDRLRHYKSLDASVSFSKDLDVQAETIAKVNAANEESRALTMKYDDFGNKLIIGKSYIGVTKAIDNARMQGQRVVPEFDGKAYIQDRVEKTLQQYRSSGYLEHESDDVLRVKIADEVNQDLKNWSKLGSFGTDVHAVMDYWFKNPNKHTFEDVREIASNKLSDYSLTQLIDSLTKLENTIKFEHGDGAQVFTEFKIHDPGTKIAGIIDLLVVDKKGKATIYDLKTSYKDLDEWSNIKTLKMKYQMALYRQLLRVKNIDVADIRIIPSKMTGIDYNTEVVNGLELDRYISLSPDVTEHSKIQRNARAILPTSSFSFKIANDVSKEIKEELSSNFGYEIQARGFNKKAENIKNNLRTEKRASVTTGKVEEKKFFLDTLTNERVYVTEANVDEKINDYLKRLSEDTAYEARKLREHINSAKKGNKLIEKYKLSDEKANDIIVRVFNRYVEDASWSVVEDGELDDLGILCFFNDRNKTFEFVSITSNKLNEKISLAKGPSILGQFLSRKDTYKDTRLMESNTKNIEYMKIAALMNKYVDRFKEGSIGLIRVVNPHTYQVDGIDLETLKYNYSKLCYQTKHKFSLNAIKSVDPTILVFQKLSELVERDDNRLLKKFKNDLDVSEDILSSLISLQKSIQDEILRDGDIDKMTFRNETEELLALVSEAIIYQKQLTLPVEESMKVWAMNNSSMLSNPGAVNNKNVQTANNFLGMAMYNIRRKQLEYKENHRDLFENFFESQGYSKARRYTVGDNIKSYKNLFVRDAAGNLDRSMQLKNPDSDPTLSPEEKTFLRALLKSINELRYGRLTSEKESELKASGAYFDYPLMKGSTLSKATNASYKDVLRDYFNDMYNYNKYFSSEDEESTKKAKSMNEMYNRFESQLNSEFRAKMLSENNPEDFEVDIELMLDMMSFSRIRKQEFDKVLPVINALRIAIKYQSYNLLKDQDITIDYLQKLVAQAVFNDKMIPDHLKGFAKMTGALRDMTSKLNLGVNVFSGITNLLQGQWANLSRVLAKEFGEDMPTKAEYAKGLGILFSDVNIVNNITLVEEINNLYGFANMDLNAIVERMSQSKTGITALGSRWLFWTVGAPDYFNRMGVFLGQMIHDGSFDAHEMKNGKLVYDWTKDKRFSIYASGDKTNPKYDFQRALYLKFLEDFNSAGTESRNLQEGDPLPAAYTYRHRESFKNALDKAHGYYDHETKAMINNTILGSVFFQFKTFLTAKKDQYFQKGDTYGQGNFVQMKDYDGNLLFLDESNNLTTENTHRPAIEWKGRYMEGIYYSLVNTLEDIKEYKWNIGEVYKEAKKHPERMANFKMLATDLTIITALTVIYNLVDWKELKQDKPFTAALGRAVLGSGRDLFIGNNLTSLGLSTKNPFASVAYMSDVGNTVWGTMSGDMKPSKLIGQIGMTRPFEPLFQE